MCGVQCIPVILSVFCDFRGGGGGGGIHCILFKCASWWVLWVTVYLYLSKIIQGGPGVLTPNFGRHVPRQSENLARPPERAPCRAWKCGAPERAWAVRCSGTSLSRFERENAVLWNELDPFWAWKCESPERAWSVLRAWKCVSPERPPWEAMNGLKLKKSWKWWSPERQNPPKNVKWWCSGTDFFGGNLWKIICSGKFRAENGVSRAAHTQICIHMEVPPPPPRWPIQNGTACFQYYEGAIIGLFCSNFYWEKWYQDQQFWFSSLFSRAYFVRQCRGLNVSLFSLN